MKISPKWDRIKRQIIEEELLFFCNRNRENALLLLRESLTYLEFGDAYWDKFSDQVQILWEYLAIIYQWSLAKIYASEIIYFIAYFKQLCKEEFMQPWLDYCLINLSGHPKKLYLNDWVRKTIIKLFKEKIRPLSNAKSDKFL